MSVSYSQIPNENIHSRSAKCRTEMYMDDKPFVQIRYPSGELMCQRWFQGTFWHRENGPAEIVFSKSGEIIRERWMQFGVYHRENGPAMIRRDENGSILYQRFLIKGKLCFWKNLMYGVGNDLLTEFWIPVL